MVRLYTVQKMKKVFGKLNFIQEKLLLEIAEDKSI